MPISKNMNTKNKNARQCAANSYTPQHPETPIRFPVALVQSEQVFTKDILQNYTNMSTRQVKTSDDPKCIFRFMLNRIKKDGTRNIIIHLNDEHLLMFVNYLEGKLTNYKIYRSLFKGVTIAATLSTADNVRYQLASTKYAKQYIRFLQSPLRVVLSTFEDGRRDFSTFEDGRRDFLEPAKKTTLVFVSDKQTSYFNQAYEYFKDDASTKVKKIRVSELPIHPITMPIYLSGFTEVDLFLDDAVEMKKVAKCLDDNKFSGAVNVVNSNKNMLNVSEFQKLLGKKGLKIKSICSGVKNNVEEGKYSELPNYSPYDKQVLEIITQNYEFDLDQNYNRCRVRAYNTAERDACYYDLRRRVFGF